MFTANNDANDGVSRAVSVSRDRNLTCFRDITTGVANEDSAGRNIMMCSKYAMTFKFSSLFALLSRTPKSTLKGNDKMYFFSYFISEFDKQLVLYLVSSLLAMCCDVTRASSGKTENSCFVWLKFARVVQMMNELSSPNWS